MKRKFTRILGVGLTLALLTSLMVVAVPVSALTQPTVSIVTGQSVISTADADYTIIFVLGKDLEVNDTITITFPVGTTITGGNLTGGVTFATSPGWVVGTWDDTPTATATWAGTAATRTIVGTVATEAIGASATVRVVIATGIKNPATIGTYELTVKTSDETTAVTSASYSIVAPTVTTLPGVVEVYNPVDILMDSFTGDTALESAANLAGEDYTIKIGPGLYTTGDELNTSADDQIWIATGAAAETIIQGGVIADEDDCIIDGLTIKPLTGDVGVAITGDDVEIKNCVFLVSGTAYRTNAETMLTFDNTQDTAPPSGKVTDCTFDTTLGAVADIGISVASTADGGLTISGCTFTLDSTTGGTPDTGVINLGAGSATYPITISNCTITGASGEGVEVDGGVTKITAGSTLSGLFTALDIDGGTITVTDSTITNCGAAVSTTYTDGIAAIAVAAATKVQITNSSIIDNPNDIIEVEADAENVYLLFNDLSGNAKGVDNDDTGITLNATHNWWGAATGPATGFNTATIVDASGYLGGEATGSFDTAKTSLIKKTTVGVDVLVTDGGGTMDVVGVANYAANPQDATPETAIAGGFYDVHVSGVSGGGTDDEITLKFYNANVSATTIVYVWSVLQGAWARCAPATATAAATQGVNTFGGYAWVTVTATTTPAIADLAGTEFALTEAVTTAASITPAVTSPTFGADEVSVTPTLIWSAVAGATGYVLSVSALPDFIFPLHTASPEVNGYVFEEALDYSTTYYWRVRALVTIGDEDLKSGWGMGMFTTMTEPGEAEAVLPDITVEPAEITVEAAEAPVIDVTVEAPPAADVTVEIAPDEIVQVIPDYLLWIIVVVGAVLVIALIVLIVRTRRVV